MKVALFSLFSTLAVVLAAGGCRTELRTPAVNDPPAKAADTQKEAIRLATGEDLPALRRATRLTVTLGARGAAKDLTVVDPDVLNAVLSAMTVKETPPSGGMTWATLTWLAGDAVIRRAWVYEDGEWGFERPGTAWTTGESQALSKLLKDLLREQR